MSDFFTGSQVLNQVLSNGRLRVSSSGAHEELITNFWDTELNSAGYVTKIKYYSDSTFTTLFSTVTLTRNSANRVTRFSHVAA